MTPLSNSPLLPYLHIAGITFLYHSYHTRLLTDLVTFTRLESPSIRWIGLSREETVTRTTFQQVKKEVEVVVVVVVEVIVVLVVELEVEVLRSSGSGGEKNHYSS
jgi:hypothetical protein